MQAWSRGTLARTGLAQPLLKRLSSREEEDARFQIFVGDNSQIAYQQVSR